MGGKGSGGRNKKPTAVKLAQGNPGKRKINKREPKPPNGAPIMPNGLSRVAAAEWNRIVPLLLQMQVLTAADGAALGAYCSSYALWIQSQAAIAKFGIVVASLDEETGVAVLRVNPAVRVRSDALRSMKQFLLEFGLTPASRAKLEVSEGRDLNPDKSEGPSPSAKSQNALEEFLRRSPASSVAQ